MEISVCYLFKYIYYLKEVNVGGQLFKNLILWLVIFVTVVALWQFFDARLKKDPSIAYSDFLAKLERGEIKEVEFKGDEIEAYETKKEESKKSFKTVGPANEELISTLKTKGIVFS